MRLYVIEDVNYKEIYQMYIDVLLPIDSHIMIGLAEYKIKDYFYSNDKYYMIVRRIAAYDISYSDKIF